MKLVNRSVRRLKQQIADPAKKEENLKLVGEIERAVVFAKSQPMPEVGKGWIYSPPTARELKRCMQAQAKTAPVRPKACSTEQKILGLCGSQ